MIVPISETHDVIHDVDSDGASRMRILFLFVISSIMRGSDCRILTWLIIFANWELVAKDNQTVH